VPPIAATCATPTYCSGGNRSIHLSYGRTGILRELDRTFFYGGKALALSRQFSRNSQSAILVPETWKPWKPLETITRFKPWLLTSVSG